MNKTETLALLKLKTYLLCYGIRENRYSEEFAALQNPSAIHKSGYIGLHFFLHDQIPTLASTTNKYDKKSIFEIVKRNDHYFLQSNDGELIPITSIPMPSWYTEKTKTGKSLSGIFAHEGIHYLHEQYSGCALMVNGKGCKFCSVGKTFLVHSPQEVAETALVAFNQDSHYQVCLGGGVKIVPNNFNYFLSCVQEIRKLNSTVKIWIEMVPPSNNTDIQDMIDAGANGFGFNLEIWDDTIRKEVCPGKSAITKQRYFEAWEYVQKQLGQNRVNTALLTGLEPYESTEQGIYEITKQGVRITLLPFKPWDGSVYESREPSDPEKHFQLAYTLAEQMKKYNVIPEMNLGCANCESCTIEDNILHYIQDNA